MARGEQAETFANTKNSVLQSSLGIEAAGQCLANIRKVSNHRDSLWCPAKVVLYESRLCYLDGMMMISEQTFLALVYRIG